MAKGKGGFIGQDGLNAPDAPTGVSGTAGDTQVDVSFTSPSDVGGSAITSYLVTDSTKTHTATGSSSPVTVTGLTNGTSYTFNVWAINAFGWSAPSDATGTLTPALLQRALFAGGSSNIIDYVDITTAGNATDFGDLIASDRFLGGFGSATRGIFSGGDNTNRIQYVTIATTGNATDFGDMSYTPDNNGEGGCSNSTRGMNGGGYNAGFQNNIDYVTIATTGNGTDFGNLTSGRYGTSALASPTRGVWSGGDTGSFQNVIDYVTISSTGNASDFGDLTSVRRDSASLSSSTRGVIGGSYTAPGSTPLYRNLDYITIASTGNAANFGDITVYSGFAGGAGTSGSTKGLFALGTANIDQITIATTGSAADFGDLTSSRSQLTATSSYHGGLQ